MPETAQKQLDPIEEARMTIGEHLDELRVVVVRAASAVFVAFLLCLWPAQYALALVARPVLVALKAHNQPTTFLSTGPLEGVVIYLKMVLVLALIIAGPYVIYQLWHFVAQGLHANEKQWVYKVVPFSIGLFLLGVAFMYFFVLVISLHFLIGFTTWFPAPNIEANFLERMVIGTEAEPTPDPATEAVFSEMRAPIVAQDPVSPADGDLWINRESREIKTRLDGKTYVIDMRPVEGGSMMLTHFRFGEYISFLLMMLIAFGLAFQSPLVVMFLTMSGIVPLASMRRSRRLIVLVIVIVAAFLSPADLISHVLLSTCMILLFELGMFLSARYERRKQDAAAA